VRAVGIAKGNTRTIDIELYFPFRFLKNLTEDRTARQNGFHFGGSFIGKVTDGRVRKRNAAEFLQIIGGDTIRAESATSGNETPRYSCVTLFYPRVASAGKRCFLHGEQE
jgi:hypothetical protein